MTAPRPERSDESRLPLGAIQRMARGTLQVSVAKAIGGISAFVIVTVVLRALGTAGAGYFFELVALVTIISSFGTGGADITTIRETAQKLRLGQSHAIRPTLTIALAPVVIVAGGVVFGLEFGAPAIAGAMYHGPHSADAILALRVVVVAIPMLVVERVLLGATRGLGSAMATAVIDSAGLPTLRLALAACAALVGSSLLRFAVAWMIPAVVCCVAAVVWMSRLLQHVPAEGCGWWRKYPGRRQATAQFWEFSYARGIASTLQVCSVWIGVLLTGWWASARAAGQFGGISRIALVGVTFIQALNVVLSPMIASALAVEDRPGAQELYQTATGWVVLFGVPVYLVVGVWSKTILGIMGSGVAAAWPAFSVICVAMVWNIMTGPVTDVLLMGGKSKWNLWNTVASLAANVIAGALLIPSHGVTGAAIAWAIGITVDNVLPVIEVKVALKLSPFSRSSIFTTIGAVVVFGGSGLAARFAGIGGPTAFLAISVASAVVYIVLVVMPLRRALKIRVLLSGARSSTTQLGSSATPAVVPAQMYEVSPSVAEP